jgi:predicted RNA-binding protein YlqC (UPF0109 family)
MEERDRLRLLTTTLVGAIANDKEDVQVSVEDREGGLVVRVRVAPDDMGKVIGKKGRVASALRTVVRAAAGSDSEITLEIEDGQ